MDSMVATAELNTKLSFSEMMFDWDWSRAEKVVLADDPDVLNESDK